MIIGIVIISLIRAVKALHICLLQIKAYNAVIHLPAGLQLFQKIFSLDILIKKKQKKNTCWTKAAEKWVGTVKLIGHIYWVKYLGNYF